MEVTQSNLDRRACLIALLIPFLINIYLIVMGVLALSSEGSGRAQADMEYGLSLLALGSINVLYSILSAGILRVRKRHFDLRSVYFIIMALVPFILFYGFRALF